MPPSTELPPAAWSAEADVGAERRNPVPLSQKSRCLAGRRPAKARRATPNRRRARSNQTARRLPRGFLWPRGDRGTPRVLMMPPSRGAWRCKRGRGRSLPGRADRPQRWQARRAETVLAAPVGHRHARAAALDGKRNGVKGTLAAPAAAPPVSRSETTDRPLALSYPTPAPGPRCGPGARSIHVSRPREPAARTRLWRDPSPDVRGPVVHQDPPPVEQVGAPVGRFHAIAVDVRKRELADLARRVGALRRPVPKA